MSQTLKRDSSSTLAPGLAKETPATALVHLDGTAEKLGQLIEYACQLAKLKVTNWRQSPDGGWPSVDPPVVGIGVLRAGDRRVPPDLSLASRVFPGLPIVLAAGEPLTREVVLFNRLQLSLFDPSLSAVKLAEHLQRVIQNASRSPDITFSAHYTRVFRPTFGWVASLSRFPSPREVNEAELVFPWVSMTPDATQMAAVIPSWTQSEKLSVQACQQTLAVFEGDPGTMEARVSKQLGGQALVIGASKHSVQAYIPQGAGVVWLLSHNRLPTRWCLSADGGGAVRQMAPTPGDLFILHSHSEWVPPPDMPSEGAKLLRQFQQDAPVHGLPAASLLIEVW